MLFGLVAVSNEFRREVPQKLQKLKPAHKVLGPSVYWFVQRSALGVSANVVYTCECNGVLRRVSVW